MSRSSTDTGMGTPCTGQPPSLNWAVIQHQQHHVHMNNCASDTLGSKTTTTVSSTTATGLDRMSVCSSHGSFGSNSSEYSVPRQTCNVQPNASSMAHDLWYEHASQTQETNSKNQRASGNASILPQSSSTAPAAQACKTCPPSRPPKSKVYANGKALMPLPIAEQLTSVATITSQPSQQQLQQSIKFVGSYENYDVPRIPMQIHQSQRAAATDNYDTPKKIQECLTEDSQALATTTKYIDIYGNYDVPAIINENSSTSAVKENDNRIRFTGIVANGIGLDGGTSENTARIDCSCNKVMSWADSWISLPYCRRGNSIENTGVPINKVRLSGEGKMPVVQPSGELAVYATVDMTKKIKRRILEDMQTCECSHSSDFVDYVGSDGSAQSQSSNYINIEPTMPSKSALPRDDGCESDVDKETNQNTLQSKETMQNYMNLDYALSLENYENAKEVLQRAGFSVTHIEDTLAQCVLHRNICNKCGHSSKRMQNQIRDDTIACTQAPNTEADQNNELKMPEDYILMEPRKKNFPGYLPMSPAAPNNGTALSEIVVPSPSTSSEPAMALNQQTAVVNVHSKTPPIPSKSDLMKRILGDKSASNSLPGPAVDRSKKRAEQETRIPGSAMMSSLNSGGSPYTRKQLMDNGDLLPSHDKRAFGRKRSSSADSTRLSAISNLISNKTAHRRSVSAIDNVTIKARRASTPCLHLKDELPTTNQSSEIDRPKRCASPTTMEQRSTTTDTDDEISLSMNQSLLSQQSQQSTVYIRRSASVPCKAQNRDSSSSNDSGVSTGSTRQRGNGEYAEFELPLTTAISTIRHQRNASVLPALTSTLHASLPRRSKSFDPLREITFQFARNGKFTEKSTSAEAEIPICTPKAINGAKGGHVSPNDATSFTGSGHPYIDSRSTSSGTSDMSDYIETLSLSSHSSSDTPEGLRYHLYHSLICFFLCTSLFCHILTHHISNLQRD